MTRSDRIVPAGFTLLEVVVALAIGGIAVMLAASMLGAVTDQAASVEERARAGDRSGTSSAVLRRVIGQMDWPRKADPPSSGDSAAARFMSWCDAPAGRSERCAVELVLPSAGDIDAGLIMRATVGQELRLLPRRQVSRLLYLESAERGGRWSSTWTDASSLPPAIGVVMEADTLILRVGDRG